MLGSDFTREEYIKEIRRLERNLKQRAKKIERRGNLASQNLPNKLRELRNKYPDILTTMSKAEARSYYRELRNLDTMKSSTVKGATDVRQSFGYVEDKLSNFTDEQKEKLFQLYGKVYENFIIYAQEFKYEILETAADIVDQYSGGDVDRLTEEIINELEDLYEREQLNDYTQEELQDDFLQLMHKIQQFYF